MGDQRRCGATSDTIVVPQYPLRLTHEDQDDVNEDGEEKLIQTKKLSGICVSMKTDMQLITYNTLGTRRR